MTEDLLREPMISAFKDELSETDRKALTVAAQVLIDQWFEDLENAHINWIMLWMPDAYASRYDIGFVRNMIVSASVVAAKLCDPRGWAGLSCVGEELCLNAIIMQARESEEAFGFALSDEGASTLYDLAFEDLDFRFLFDPSMDGIGSSEAMGMAFLEFPDWFESFGGQGVGPFVSSEKAFIDDEGHVIDLHLEEGQS